MKCDTCLNRYAVISENGLHYNCSLSEKTAINCLVGKKDNYVKLPTIKDEDKED